jgi:hypothetical protein
VTIQVIRTSGHIKCLLTSTEKGFEMIPRVLAACTALILCVSACSQSTPGERAAKLNAQIDVMAKEGRFAEAVEAARERLEIVMNDPEARLYETTSAERELSGLQQIAGLPRSAQDDLARAARLEADMREDFRNGEYASAAEAARIQLSIRREHLGNSHVDVGTTLNNLAYAETRQEAYAEAESLYVESLGILREQLGSNHPVIVRVLNNLGGVLESQERGAEAEALYRQALALGREALGERHPEVSRSLLKLSDVVSDPAEADSLEQQFLRSAFAPRGDVTEK